MHLKWDTHKGQISITCFQLPRKYFSVKTSHSSQNPWKTLSVSKESALFVVFPSQISSISWEFHKVEIKDRGVFVSVWIASPWLGLNENILLLCCFFHWNIGFNCFSHQLLKPAKIMYKNVWVLILQFDMFLEWKRSVAKWFCRGLENEAPFAKWNCCVLRANSCHV